MAAEMTLEERKARELIKLRGYRFIKREDRKTYIQLLARVPKTKGRVYLWCIPMEATVGVQYVDQLKKAMNADGVEGGIIIAHGGYTPAAEAGAAKRGVELIPKFFPAFEIFKHTLVPRHEVLGEEERAEVLKRYRVQPHQLPQIKATDPAAIAIGARPGDIVRITRDSPTAGKHVLYKYVIEG